MTPKSKPKPSKQTRRRKAGEPLKNARHEAFARGVSEGKTAHQAHEDAGFSRRSQGNTTRLGANKLVQERIRELKDAAAERTVVSVARTVEEWRRLAYFNPKDLFNESGQLRNINELSDEVAAAIASIEITETGGLETLKKIRLWDKKGVLDQVARYLGMFEKDNEQSKGIVSINIRNA